MICFDVVIVVSQAHNSSYQISLQDATTYLVTKQPGQGSGSNAFTAESFMICTTHQHSRRIDDTCLPIISSLMYLLRFTLFAFKLRHRVSALYTPEQYGTYSTVEAIHIPRVGAWFNPVKSRPPVIFVENPHTHRRWALYLQVSFMHEHRMWASPVTPLSHTTLLRTMEVRHDEDCASLVMLYTYLLHAEVQPCRTTQYQQCCSA